MAIVVDKARFDGKNPAGSVDKPLNQPNRSGAGTPVATLTPQYAGEWYYDTTGNLWWRGISTSGTAAGVNWVQENRSSDTD